MSTCTYALTLTHVRLAGADKFCWLSPGEKLMAEGQEPITLSPTGAFVYLAKGGQPLVWFARMPHDEAWL